MGNRNNSAKSEADPRIRMGNSSVPFLSERELLSATATIESSKLGKKLSVSASPQHDEWGGNLRAFAKYGMLALLERHLTQRGSLDLESCNKFGETPFIVACKYGCKEAVTCGA